MADRYIMTDGEAKEYVRLCGKYDELVSAVDWRPDSFAADLRRSGITLRVYGDERPRDEGNEQIGWDAAHRLIGPPGNDYQDSELVERAVRSAVANRQRRASWAAVKATFSCGSTVARALCRRFGIDPDEEAP